MSRNSRDLNKSLRYPEFERYIYGNLLLGHDIKYSNLKVIFIAWKYIDKLKPYIILHQIDFNSTTHFQFN